MLTRVWRLFGSVADVTNGIIFQLSLAPLILFDFVWLEDI